jgi:hypothetical protein
MGRRQGAGLSRTTGPNVRVSVVWPAKPERIAISATDKVGAGGVPASSFTLEAALPIATPSFKKELEEGIAHARQELERPPKPTYQVPYWAYRRR